jgi:hypothetical protein
VIDREKTDSQKTHREREKTERITENERTKRKREDIERERA